MRDKNLLIGSILCFVGAAGLTLCLSDTLVQTLLINFSVLGLLVIVRLVARGKI